MDAIEAKIEAIKSLFVPFDLEVEIRIGSNTETNDNGSLNRYYDCELVCVDEFDDIDVKFIANEHTKKINGNDVVIPVVTAPHLQEALDELYDFCVDAIQRKYDVEFWNDDYPDNDDEECQFLDD